MKFKVILSQFLLICLIGINATPAFAIFERKNKQKTIQSGIEYINFNWWTQNNDEYLTQYIAKAIDNNNDLRIATLRVEEARQNAKLQFANELPTVGVAASPALIKNIGSTSTEGMFSIPMLVSYELDIFLKNHDKTKSAKKIYEASQLNEKASYIAVASAVGSTYYNIVKADKLIELQKQIVSDRKKIYELMDQRNKEGITSTADLVKAQKSFILAQSDLIELEKLQVNLLTSLAVLIGDNPNNIGEYKRIAYDDMHINKSIPTEIPSEIITNRPDYMVAEKMIEKAGIDVRVAKKEFLPSFNIGGIMALISSSNGLNMNLASNLAGAGISAILPVFTGGRRIAALKIYKNKYEQAIQEYMKTNNTAIKEVNDALSDLKKDKQKYDHNLYALKMETKDFKYTEDQYKEGIISYLDLVQKREVLLSTKKLVVSSDIDKNISHISLYKATAAANLN